MGVKKNILYSGFLTTSLYVFQFLTYPYVARVLGVSNIGICNFMQSIVQYFMLFSMLGIITLGTREVAKHKQNKEELNVIFSSLFQLNLLLTLAVLAFYVFVIETFPNFSQYKDFLYIGCLQIFFNTLTVEWFFRGIEDFKYISIRTFVIRVLYVISIFVFIRNTDDYKLYFILTTGTYVLNGLINSYKGLQLVRFSWQPMKNVFTNYGKSIIMLGLYDVLTNMYLSFNVLYLGVVSTNAEVGYYTTATKITNVLLALYTSFTMVMLPRISSMIANNDTLAVKTTISKSFNLLYALAFPIIILGITYAKEIIYLIAGQGYEDAVLLLQISMPVILVIGIEQILILQLLLPLREDKTVLINALIAAVLSLSLNLLLVRRFDSMGSILVWLVSETTVLLLANRAVRTIMGTVIALKDLLKYVVAFVPLLILCLVARSLFNENVISFFFSLFITAFYSHLCLYFVLKNELYVYYIREKFLVKFHNIGG